MNLVQKTICIIGGSGYVGTAVARLAQKHGLKVFCVQRSRGPADDLITNNKINYIKGDAMEPEKFKDVILESDYFVHTVGTLLDSSILKNKQPGQPGTYEHLNRDTAISMGGKKIVYVSASRSPPFIPRYLSTKVEAEEFLLSQPNLGSIILKPGFIYSYQNRKWSAPLKYAVDAWHCGFGIVYDKVIPKNTMMNNITGQLLVDKSVRLEDVSNAALVGLINDQYTGKLLYNDDMVNITKNYEKNGSLFFK